MSLRTTIAAVRGLPNPIWVPYCGVQTLLRGHNPVAYTAGKYGWNFDVYQVYGITISTGYRGMPGIKAKEYSEYERKALEVWDEACTQGLTEKYDWAQEETERLLREFCELNKKEFERKNLNV